MKAPMFTGLTALGLGLLVACGGRQPVELIGRHAEAGVAHAERIKDPLA